MTLNSQSMNALAQSDVNNNEMFFRYSGIMGIQNVYQMSRLVKSKKQFKNKTQTNPNEKPVIRNEMRTFRNKKQLIES